MNTYWMVTMRINKYIARCGIASRRKAEQLVIDGHIQVNGRTIDDLATRVDPDKDLVTYKGRPIELVENKYYLMLNKPVGYTCTNEDIYAEKTIFDLIDIDTKLFSIGRLDKDSSGLILITNDGDIYNKIMHPSSQVCKKYLVGLNRKFNKKDQVFFEKGIDIGGYITNPSSLEYRKEDDQLYISIDEGKNRQIRRMFQALDYRVDKLHRVSVGQIQLGDLELGHYRKLNEKELNYLRKL